MANTPFMNLTLPVVSTTLGTDWATLLNAAIDSIDAHDHTANKGNLIPTAALKINDNLNLNNFTIFNALSLKLTTNLATLTGAFNASSIYAVSGNLYFTNGSGVAVQVTSGGSVVSTPTSAQTFEVVAISGNLTISAVDTYVVVSVDTSANRAISLPSIGAVSAGRIFIIADATGSSFTHPITISPNGADKIANVNAAVTIKSGSESLMFISDGNSNWIIA